ncbi:MAG: GAF domain-containing protein [Chloroflexota bacterium]
MSAYDTVFGEAFAEIVPRFDTLDEVLDEICEWLLMDFDLYFVGIHQPTGHHNRIQMMAGSPWAAFDIIRRASVGLSSDSIASVVTVAAARGEVYLIDDCMNDPLFLPNPILPMTRSQLAIPLMDGATCLGVFDMQSTAVAAFHTRDMSWIPALSQAVTDVIVNYQNP